MIKRKLQNQFLLYFLLFSVCPLLVLAFFSYYNVKVNAEHELSAAIANDLKQSQATLDERYYKYSKYMDIVSNSAQFHDVINRITPYVQDENYAIAQLNGVNLLDPIFKSLFAADIDIDQVLVILNNRCLYSYNSYFPIDRKLEQDHLIKSMADSSKTLWLSYVDNPFGYYAGTYMIVSKDIKDLYSGNPDKSLCQLVLLVSEDRVTDVLSKFSRYTGNIAAVLDRSNQLIGINNRTDANIKNVIDVTGKMVPFENSDIHSVNVSSYDNYIVTYTVSRLSGWKFVQLTPKKLMASTSRSIVIFTIILVLGLLCAMILFSFFIYRNLLIPVKRLASAMKEVGKKNFSVAVAKHSEDEIGEICHGFNEMVANLDILFKLTVEKENQKRQFQMDMLKYQINPHFLYNTLNSMRHCAIKQNDDKMADMLLVLSRLFRNTLTKTSNLISLLQEIENVKDYIFLQQVRYDNRLTIEYDISTSTMGLLVPGMILQPIIENSIMHGLTEKLNSRSYSEIKITTWMADENRLVISVCDNGSGISSDKINSILQDDCNTLSDSSHIGLKNIHERIRLQYGDLYGINCESIVGTYTCVKIYLPVLRNEER